jgi:acetyl esterase/lipase
MKTVFIIALVTVSLTMTTLQAQETPSPLPLWQGTVPASAGTSEKDVPYLIPYLPDVEKATGTAIVICPGGGYGHLAMDHEGHQIARWFSEHGIAAFILRYRLPVDGYRHPIPLLDAQQAIRKIRSEASQRGLSPDRIGILGFSAGGHLASSVATHFQKPVLLESMEPGISSVSCRPDFQVLVYPVITMQNSVTHGGSRKNLLGDNPSSELIDLMSNEKQVTPQTPPAFLVHANDDRGVVPENSILFYEALRKSNVPAELHIFFKGGHGFGMRPQTGPAADWPRLCTDWLKMMELLR